MTGMYGADVAQLRGLARQFDQAAEQLERGRMEVGNGIQISAWIGPFATSFRLRWESEHSARIANAAGRLRDEARRLGTNADEQERASAVDGDTVSGTTTPSSSSTGDSAPAPATPIPPASAAPLAAAPSGPGDTGSPHQGSGPAGSQDYSVQRAVDLAKSEVGTTRPTGWNAEGECIKSVQRWINSAGGHFGGGGVVSGYENSGAIAVGLDQARAGDVIQYTSKANPDAFVGGVHTVMVAGVNPDGSLHIIQSNAGDPGKVTEVLSWRPSPPAGFDARTWRFAKHD